MTSSAVCGNNNFLSYLFLICVQLFTFCFKGIKGHSCHHDCAAPHLGSLWKEFAALSFGRESNGCACSAHRKARTGHTQTRRPVTLPFRPDAPGEYRRTCAHTAHTAAAGPPSFCTSQPVNTHVYFCCMSWAVRSNDLQRDVVKRRPLVDAAWFDTAGRASRRTYILAGKRRTGQTLYIPLGKSSLNFQFPRFSLFY